MVSWNQLATERLVATFGGCCDVMTEVHGKSLILRVKTHSNSINRITPALVRRSPDGCFKIYGQDYFIHESTVLNRGG